MKAPLPPPPKRRRGTRSAPAQSAPAEPAQPAQQEASREIASQESAPAESAPTESASVEHAPSEPTAAETIPEEPVPEKPAPEESGPAESAPAEPAPAEPTPMEPTPAESAPAESAPEESVSAAEPQEGSREIVPETTATEEAVPEKATVEENEPAKAEESVLESVSQAENAPEQTSTENAIQDQGSEEPKPESESTNHAASVQEDQSPESQAQDDPQVSEDASEVKEATSEQPEHQEEATRELQESTEAGGPEQEKVEDSSSKPESDSAEPTQELQETKEAGEPEKDEVENESTKPEPSTADEQTGDRELIHAEEEKTTSEPAQLQEEAAPEPLPDTHDAEQSKPDNAEDNAVKDDSQTSDHQAEAEQIIHDEKPVDEPSASQEESTRELPSEPIDSKEDAVAEHSASAPSEPEHDVSHSEEAPPTESQPVEETPSAPETTVAPAPEEQPTEHSDPSSEGIAKGGAAEEYLKMAEAEPESHHEDSTAVNGDKSEPELSSTQEHATSQEDTSTAEPTETRDISNAEAADKGDDSSAPVHEDESASAKPEETQGSAGVEREIAPSETHDVNNTSEESIENADRSAPVQEDQSSQAKSEGRSVPAQVESEVAPSETHDENKTSEGVDSSSSVPGAQSSQDKHEEASDPAQVEIEAAPSGTHDENKTLEIDESSASIPEDKPSQDDAEATSAPAETETRDGDKIDEFKETGHSSDPGQDEKETALEPTSETHAENPSATNEDSTTAEPQPEADSRALKSEDHDMGDSTAQDGGHDQHPSGSISQDLHDEPPSQDVDPTTDSSIQPQADSESGTKPEVEPQSETLNEAKPDINEAESGDQNTATGSHGDASLSKEIDEHVSTEPSVEPSAEPQQKVVSRDNDHQGLEKDGALPDTANEDKDGETESSKDLEGGDELKDPEHKDDGAEDQAFDDSAQSVENSHPSVEQAALAVPNTSADSEPQQPEITEQVLEGSGNDQAPSRGLDVKDSEGHPAEENFDLSGNEPIPGTMTHGSDPEGAEQDTKDGGLGDKTPDRDLDTEAVDEKAGDALGDSAIVDKAADSQESVSHEDGYEPETGDHRALDHVFEHQPEAEAQNLKSTEVNEPEERPSSVVPSSHDQDATPTEGQDTWEKSHEEPRENLVDETQGTTTEQTAEVEQPLQDAGANQGHSGELNEERSIVEDSEKPMEHEAPEISVTEHKPDDDAHLQDSKPIEGADTLSSQDLKQTGLDATPAAQTEGSWEDKHSSTDARRPSTILTDNLNTDDDADAGLFAVPPTPRDEIDQQKPTSLQTSSTPSQVERGLDDHDAGSSLPTKAVESHDTSYGPESYATGHDAAAEHHATEDHEEDRSSLPPWSAQNGQSEELPPLQTGSAGHDIDARDTSSAHSRDGSYHEDFQLSPVAYTPVDKKSRSVESFEQQRAQDGLDDNHDKHVSGDIKPEMSSAHPEEQDVYHRDLAQPDELHDTNGAHIASEHQHPVDQSFKWGSADLHKEPLEEEPKRNNHQDQYVPRTEDSYDQSLDDYYGRDLDENVTHNQQPTSYASGVNYDGEGYGPSPTEEHHYDTSTTAFPQSAQSAYSPGLTGASQSATRSSFSGHETAGYSYSDDRTETESHTVDTPTVSTRFDKDPGYERAETPEQFHHALGNLPDESAHTVQGTDDLFDDDDDDDNASSHYGEAIVEPTEKIVYQANGSHENVALGGNHSSLSLGRNSMASQGSYGHHSAGSRSSLGSVRETTPLRVADGSYLATSPSIVRADWAADYEDEIRRPSRATPQLQPSTAHDTPGISPFALRNTPAGSALGEDDRGLAASRWSPRAARPETPPSRTRQAASDSPQTPSSASRLSRNNPFRAQSNTDAEEIDPSLYMPRDVTNTPWHARNDSIPMSLHSQTTLSSAQDSPIHSSLAVDKHEPVIRDSWPTPAPGYQQYLSSWGGRPRGDSSLSSNNGDYDPFKAESNGSGNVNKSSIYNPFQQRGRAESSVSAAPSVAPSAASASPSRGGLFHKMRSVFEQGSSGASEAPSLTRPVSGTYHAVSPMRSPARPEQAGRQEEQQYSNRPGY